MWQNPSGLNNEACYVMLCNAASKLGSFGYLNVMLVKKEIKLPLGIKSIRSSSTLHVRFKELP